MTAITIRANEGADAQPYLAWDTVFDNQALGDWALAGPGEKLNRGGLQAKAGLATAVELALFSDRRCPPDHPLAKLADDGDLGGWWGNSVDLRADLGEAELGSLLWLLERAALTDDIVRWAQALAEEALAPIVVQGAAAKIEVTAERAGGSRLNLWVNLFARDGSAIYSRKFEILWQQVGL